MSSSVSSEPATSPASPEAAIPTPTAQGKPKLRHASVFKKMCLHKYVRRINLGILKSRKIVFYTSTYITWISVNKMTALS